MDDRKRKRPDGPAAVPESGVVKDIFAQVIHAVEYLRVKDRPLPFNDIWDYLSMPPEQSKQRANLLNGLVNHPKAEYLPGPPPTFRFRPIHNVRNGDELIAYLQKQTTAQGISVKELKDGWATANTEIEALEAKGLLLVLRNKKDNSPKMVWSNDPSLSIHIEDDFQTYWGKTNLPSNPSDMRLELEKAGLTPTSQVKETVKVLPTKKDKRRVNRKAGRSTNTHMMGILKDYGFKK